MSDGTDDQHGGAEVFADATEMRGTGTAMIELEHVDKFFIPRPEGARS